MNEIAFEIFVIFCLCLVNGLFALAELGVVSANRQRLQRLAEAGDRAAAKALLVSENPAHFLATVQVGITLIGILAGVFGGATLAEDLALYLSGFSYLERAAHPIAFGSVVGAITFVSLVVGELVPKQIALSYPERVAMMAATPFSGLAIAAKPIVYLLDRSTSFIVSLLPFPVGDRSEVSQADIHNILNAGAASGEISEQEKEIAHRALTLDDRPVSAFMTPRREVVWLDCNHSREELIAQALATPHSFFPVADGTLDKTVGVVAAKDLMGLVYSGTSHDILAISKPPFFLPNSAKPLSVLERFRQERRQIAILVDEYGGFDGVLTTHDLLEALVGDLADYEGEEASVVKRSDGSYLVAGSSDLNEVALLIPGFTEGIDSQGSVAGLLLGILGRVPVEGERCRWREFDIEIIDMDSTRIDKVLVVPIGSATPQEGAAS